MEKMGAPAEKLDHLKKGPWTADEDRRLTAYIKSHDNIRWASVNTAAGISRSGKSCRLRWYNYLNPAIKRWDFTHEETDLIAKLHRVIGNRWSIIASKLPGRTEKEVKKYWNQHAKTNNLFTPQKMSSVSICSDGFTSNDEWSSDVSEILSELSSNAGDPCLLTDDLTFVPKHEFKPNDGFGLDGGSGYGLDGDFGLDYAFDLDGDFGFGLNGDFGLDGVLDLDVEGFSWDLLLGDANFASNRILDQFSGDLFGKSMDENDSGVGQSNVTMPFPAAAQDHQNENKTTPSDDVTPHHLQGVPQVDYLYGSETTLNDTDDDDEQNNGEICLSLEVIKQHLHMNMDDAVESLKISRSTLKRICRKYGIKRWPCHKRRKIDDKQPSNIKNLKKDINTVQCASSSNSSVTIKATYQDDIMKFPFSVSSKLSDLREEVAKRLDLGIHNFKFKYKDGDGDLVLIACDEDLHGYFDKRLSYNATYDIFVFPVTNICNKAMDRHVSSSVEEIEVNDNLIDTQAEDGELKSRSLRKYSEL